jgi:hypothetical protein
MNTELDDLITSFNYRISYQYDLFISYSSGQAKQAEAIYHRLSKSMMVFYAPISLKTLEHTPNQYVEVLSDALRQSCQVLVLLSESYLDSSWCILELNGYFNLFLEEPKRRMAIIPIEPEIDKKVAGQFVPLIYPKKEALQKVKQHYDNKIITVGEKFADRIPPKLFLDLPLYERYEPPTRNNRPPWGKDSRSPHGIPGAPPYEIYQQLVREYMVQILRGKYNIFELDKLELSIPMLGVDERYNYIKRDARMDASSLNNLGYSPYSGTAKLNGRDMFAKAMKAYRNRSEITEETDFHEAFGKICMGNLDEGIKKMEMAIEENPGISNLKFYKIELARAKLISKDFAGAIKELDTIEIEYEPEILVRAAALARLGKLSEKEKQKNRSSGISLNKIRMWSLLENRKQLDYWIESLELAGYKH